MTANKRTSARLARNASIKSQNNIAVGCLPPGVQTKSGTFVRGAREARLTVSDIRYHRLLHTQYTRARARTCCLQLTLQLSQ